MFDDVRQHPTKPRETAGSRLTAGVTTVLVCGCRKSVTKLADELGIEINVHHLPPGTGKWNKIEHRMFSFTSMNWRAKPLISYRVIVDLISAQPPPIPV
jgi:Rhodopirellula transposase DDE domain